jgi:hypothetical protein
MANAATKDPPPEVSLTAAGDPTPPTITPLILNDGYFELSGTNLSCAVKHLEAVFPEVKLVTITSFCGEYDVPGLVKYHLRATLFQDFSTGSVDSVLYAAYQAYVTSSTPVAWKARPHASQVASASNPIISGLAVPQPYLWLGGDAGNASEVTIDWQLTAPPTRNTGAVTATGAVAGTPGYYTPSGATVPANLAALAGVVASPATNWASGQYVVTADLLAANWTGSAWAAGKHA